jgi:hypothetical protein
MKILVDCDIKPVFDFECDEATAAANCHEIIDLLIKNDKKYKDGLISADEWVNFKIGHTYELEDYQAYMREMDWTAIPQLPNNMIESLLPTE